jgi:ABC-type transport system substrate-binding protein/DNA-binding SARP family transcriptional activator/DNA-binding beta-propeller fold protein YncE
MEFRILGPVEALSAGRALSLGGPRQRALLSLLLLNANRVVSRDRLIDELLPEVSSDTVDHALRVQVSRLRKALAQPEDAQEPRLLGKPPGYLLRVETHELDLLRFEALVADGRAALDAGDDEPAVELLRAADSLWRGQPLAGVSEPPALRAEAERLEEMRAAAAEERADIELKLGLHSRLVVELGRRVAESPLRERPRAQLMLALYRCGRQAQALDVYRDGRRMTSEQLGLEPGRPLKELEQAILRHDPELDAPPGPAPPPPSEPTIAKLTPTRTAETSRRGAWALRGLLAIGLVVAIVIGLVLKSGGRELVAGTTGVGLIDARAQRLVSFGASANQLGGIATEGDGAWITDPADDLLVELDRNARVTARIPVGGRPEGVVTGLGGVWVVNQADRSVWEINPRTVRRVRVFRVGSGAEAIAFGYGALWVANTVDDTLSRIDPVNGRVRTIRLQGAPGGIAVGPDGVWVTSRSTGQLLLIDPHTDEVSAAEQISSEPAGLAVADGYVWVANPSEGTIARFDPSSGQVRKIPAEGSPVAVAVADGSIWVADGDGGKVTRVEARTLATHEIGVGGAPTGLTASRQGVWVTIASPLRSHRGGTLRVAELAPYAAEGGSSVDPQTFAGFAQWQMLSLTSDGLVGYKHGGGLAGSTLVPDLATALPAPSDGGRSYTFRLRAGVTYSNGAPVRPEDFRRAFQRLFHLGDPYAESFYTSLVGAGDCNRPAHRCELSQGIVVDDRQQTVTFRLTRPDPDFLYKLTFPWAAAVPASTPLRDQGRTPVPGTGPYMTQSITPSPRTARTGAAPSFHTWTLIRNPHYRQWSADAQPAGYPDQIVLTNDADPAGAVGGLEHGRFDVLAPAPADSLGALQAQQAVDLRDEPVAGTFWLAMNTRVAPFDRIAARRALNYAIDRRRIVRLAGGPSLASPTCQILPPGLGGFEPYCPYTRDPNPSGGWSAPDLAKARRLVRESATAGMRVRLLLPPDTSVDPTNGVGRYVAAVLRSIGYRATTQVSAEAYGQAGDSKNRVQLSWDAWYQDYAAPSDFVVPLLTCAAFVPGSTENNNHAEFCDHGADAATRRAESLETSDPAAAEREWARVDRRLTDAAPWLSMYNLRLPIATSERTGNYEFHPFWTVLFDQLWVR